LAANLYESIRALVRLEIQNSLQAEPGVAEDGSKDDVGRPGRKGKRRANSDPQLHFPKK
jgi:hypothetical protein